MTAVESPDSPLRIVEQPPRVVIVGGGLAGLAAAVALRQNGVNVTLLEARKQLGGRAVSFTDPESDEAIDHCQHVALGCCTCFIDLFQRTGMAELLRRDRRLHFFDQRGRRYEFAATPIFPAPLHLALSLGRLGYLSFAERLGIARAMLRVIRGVPADERLTVLEWLQQQKQSPRVIREFWGLVLESALGESLDRAGWKYARKVFVDAFMSDRHGYEVLVPRESLGQLFDVRLRRWLQQHDTDIRTSTAVARIEPTDAQGQRCRVTLRDGSAIDSAIVILAVTWQQAAALLSPELLRGLPLVEQAPAIPAAPISGVHLWFDRQLTDLPHAVLPGRLSQWVFRRDLSDAIGSGFAQDQAEEHYYQVVISASYALQARSRDEIARQIHEELATVFPAAREARLLRCKLVTDKDAVFSVPVDIDGRRPKQRTPFPGLWLAGDWTLTGWPSTMESAVRSGYLAAEGILTDQGRRTRVMPEETPRVALARLLLGRRARA